MPNLGMPTIWPRYNNYAVQNITFKHTKGSGKGNNIIKIRYYLSVQTSVILVIFIDFYVFLTIFIDF